MKKENKYLLNEIHMERIMMRKDNELTMRNLRNLNQELQAQVKEVRHSTAQYGTVRYSTGQIDSWLTFCPVGFLS